MPALRPDDFAADRDASLPAALAGPASGLNSSAFRNSLLDRPQDVAAAPYDSVPAAAPAGEPRRLPAMSAANLATHDEALRLLALARSALDRGDAPGALQLAQRARALGVPDDAFAAGEPRPEHMLMEIQSVLSRQNAGATPPAGVVQAYDPGLGARDPYPVQQSVYDPAQDRSRMQPAQALGSPRELAGPVPPGAVGPMAGGQGRELYRQGLVALERQDRAAALQLFSEAWKYEAEFDPPTRQALRDKLTLLRVAMSADPAAGPPGSALEAVDAEQRLVRDKLFRDITREQSAAEKMRQNDPRGALARLQRLREQVEQETARPDVAAATAEPRGPQHPRDGRVHPAEPGRYRTPRTQSIRLGGDRTRPAEQARQTEPAGRTGGTVQQPDRRAAVRRSRSHRQTGA